MHSTHALALEVCNGIHYLAGNVNTLGLRGSVPPDDVVVVFPQSFDSYLHPQSFDGRRHDII